MRLLIRIKYCKNILRRLTRRNRLEPLQKKENAPKTKLTPEAVSIVLAEYAALRDEIIKNQELQHQFISFALIAFTTVIAFGFQTRNATLPLLYPILAMFLAIAWANQDRSTMLIAAYIRNRIESNVDDNMGWEHFAYEYYSKAEKKVSSSLQILAMRGIFVVTGLLAMLSSLSIAPFDTTIALIFAVDVVSILITFIVLRRHRLKEINEKDKIDKEASSIPQV